MKRKTSSECVIILNLHIRSIAHKAEAGTNPRDGSSEVLRPPPWERARRRLPPITLRPSQSKEPTPVQPQPTKHS